MSEIHIPDLIESTSKAIQQNIPETAKQTDGALSTVVGLFNNVILYPVKKANLKFKYKLEAFEEDLKEKIKKIPDENLQPPPLMIAGPTLEALRYAYDEEKLREMYENLLASAMDNRVSSQAHPAFVDAIQQMTSLDARVFSVISKKRQLICAEIEFVIKDISKAYVSAMPDYFAEDICDLDDPFLVSSTITNLERLGFIQITQLGLKGANYDSLKEHPYVLEREAIFREIGEYDFEIELTERAILLSNYGDQFARICLREEDDNAD